MDSDKKIILILFCLTLIFSIAVSLSVNTTELDYKQPQDSSFTETQKITVLDYKIPKDSTFTITNKEYYGVAD